MAVIDVAVAGTPYQVHVGFGLLNDTIVQAREFIRKRRVPIVADRNAFELHGERLRHSLASDGYEAVWYIVEPGEHSKSWEGLAALSDWLINEGVERGDYIFALGGGVVGDLTGFAAAIIKRGCGFVQLPTTLLAQVDSSVGGKTAINTAAGKNLVGAFHQPALVLADLATLETLPLRELQAGYAEVVKYGLLGDADFFGWCERNGRALLDGNEAAREYAVAYSVAAKARIVAADERETTGLRVLLNLGHTFGHALEAQTGFSDRLLHGEGVALGMVLAARFSAQRGLLEPADAERIAAHFASVGMVSEIASLGLNCDGQSLVAHMLHDKKMDAGTLPFLLLRSIGEAFLAKDVALEDVAAFLDGELQR